MSALTEPGGMLLRDVAEHGDCRTDRAWLALMAPEPDTRHNPGGHTHNQLDHAGKHGGGFAARLAKALSGQAALDAAPATHTPAPKGHQGNYDGAALDAPPGAGTAKAIAQYEGVEYQRINAYLRNDYRPLEKEKWESDEEWVKRRDRMLEHQAKEEAFVTPIVADIRQTMGASPLTEDVRVQRTVRRGEAVFGKEAWYGHLNLDQFTPENDPGFVKSDALYDRWIAGERPSLVGVRFQNNGFESTTADDNVAEAFGEIWARFHRESPDFEGEPIIMNMLVPKGTGSIQLSPMEKGKEAEILFEDGLIHEVIADHGIDEKGFRRVDVLVTRGGGNG
jgi:ADP-ribosyltransferase exoenzyme